LREGVGDAEALTVNDPKTPWRKVVESLLVKLGAWRLGAVVVVVEVVGGTVVVVLVAGATVVVVVGGTVVVVLVVLGGAVVVVVVPPAPAPARLVQSFALWEGLAGTWPVASSTCTIPLPSLATQML
jgi:hypothetical protein